MKINLVASSSPRFAQIKHTSTSSIWHYQPNCQPLYQRAVEAELQACGGSVTQKCIRSLLGPCPSHPGHKQSSGISAVSTKLTHSINLQKLKELPGNWTFKVNEIKGKENKQYNASRHVSKVPHAALWTGTVHGLVVGVWKLWGHQSVVPRKVWQLEDVLWHCVGLVNWRGNLHSHKTLPRERFWNERAAGSHGGVEGGSLPCLYRCQQDAATERGQRRRQDRDVARLRPTGTTGTSNHPGLSLTCESWHQLGECNRGRCRWGSQEDAQPEGGSAGGKERTSPLLQQGNMGRNLTLAASSSDSV